MKKSNVGLVVQTVLAVAIVAFTILYFFENQTLVILQSLMALFMFVLACNNHLTFKRGKWFTITYIVVGILILGAIIF